YLTGIYVAEIKLVKAFGCKVVFLKIDLGQLTTRLKEARKIKKNKTRAVSCHFCPLLFILLRQKCFL
ncbi:MAG: hypothetical protein WBL27_07410, partial [Salinimicrobium sp.]